MPNGLLEDQFVRFVQVARRDPSLLATLRLLGSAGPASRAGLLAQKAQEMRAAGVPEDVVAVLGMLEDPGLWMRLEGFLAEERAKELAEESDEMPRWPYFVIALALAVGCWAFWYTTR
jgi:hypothetical protein